MKVRDIIKMIEDDGWYVVAARGSHRQYKHPTKSRAGYYCRKTESRCSVRNNE